MTATPEQIAALKERIQSTPPEGVPFRQIVGSDINGFLVLTTEEIQQIEADEAQAAIYAARPVPPTLEERIAALEAKVL